MPRCSDRHRFIKIPHVKAALLKQSWSHCRLLSLGQKLIEDKKKQIFASLINTFLCDFLLKKIALTTTGRTADPLLQKKVFHLFFLYSGMWRTTMALGSLKSPEEDPPFLEIHGTSDKFKLRMQLKTSDG